MATYTLTVKIDPAILNLGSKDSLCLARKVNDSYSVICMAAAPTPVAGQSMLLANVTIQWSEEFRVFLTEPVRDGVMVSIPTPYRDALG